ncbi:MAG: YdbL family protein [Proteobacteria bacterium]|nr:YdbL family protein [Pseudomonadota bacterium]MBU4471648.1 YdbL family protein [Pseudomonadota bacterium]MCG2751129.1 YdbL family protein [Desulfobacteraceae bacterium]
MKKRAFLIGLFVLLIGGLVGSALAFADAETIKERMKSRLPAILELKAQGVIGENSQGFLEFVGQAMSGKDVVDAENKDRLAVYEAIGKQNGTTARAVGERRAIQIADGANPKDWLKNAEGKWYQK